MQRIYGSGLEGLSYPNDSLRFILLPSVRMLQCSYQHFTAIDVDSEFVRVMILKGNV